MGLADDVLPGGVLHLLQGRLSTSAPVPWNLCDCARSRSDGRRSMVGDHTGLVVRARACDSACSAAETARRLCSWREGFSAHGYKVRSLVSQYIMKNVNTGGLVLVYGPYPDYGVWTPKLEQFFRLARLRLLRLISAQVGP